MLLLQDSISINNYICTMRGVFVGFRRVISTEKGSLYGGHNYRRDKVKRVIVVIAPRGGTEHCSRVGKVLPKSHLLIRCDATLTVSVTDNWPSV